MHIQYYIEYDKKWLDWNNDKNRQLKEARGLCFEDVENALEQGRLLDDMPHLDVTRYPNRHILVVEIDGYTCIAPYVIDGDTLFLKTIYRSRKAQRLYLDYEHDE